MRIPKTGGRVSVKTNTTEVGGQRPGEARFLNSSEDLKAVRFAIRIEYCLFKLFISGITQGRQQWKELVHLVGSTHLRRGDDDDGFFSGHMKSVLDSIMLIKLSLLGLKILKKSFI